ncbi:helix-turn-helix domain-containing protein [Nocardia uniformis]|uniref:Helix-turn-helix domain-containing protein n=1 Tax=Nocardia uniformis TaxID=53432 RepID=A0A849C579_9NOCA|nr:helix-turn-helix transcriptional regulator [Nocardia uniformis]NNH72816.1 helix-turn-helix domain-containing protein [Nocardia uniformis]
MDRWAELGAFLKSRRAGLSPEDVGVRPVGNRRRVSGLRREELAPLARIGVDYYTRLEQGRVQGVSAEVLEAVFDALRLSPDEREYARNLAGPARTIPLGPRTVRPALQHLLDSTPDTPAYVIGPLADVIAWNQLACAMFTDFAAMAIKDRNWSHFLFVDEHMQALFDDPMIGRRENVAFLRLQLSRHPGDPDITRLVERMLARSPIFREIWATYDVADKAHNDFLFHHPVVGDLTLAFQAARLPNDPGQMLITYTAEPDTASAAALHKLRRGEPPTDAYRSA